MWRLLKAELSYNIPVFWLILLASFLGFLGIHFWPMVFRKMLDIIGNWINSVCFIFTETQVIRAVRAVCGG